MQYRSLRLMAVIGLLAAIMPVVGVRQASAAGVVGTGSAASCTETALDTALAGGGLVTFDCGGGAVTIALTTAKTIATSTEIDGGGVITLDMGDNDRHFVVNGGATLRLDSIRLDNGNVNGNGGSILNLGTVVATDVRLESNVATGTGGAIHNDGSVTIFGGSLRTNLSDGDGGAIYNSNGSTTTLGESTESRSSAFFLANTADIAGRGGAIFNDGGTVQATGFVVFSRNSSASGGAIANSSGGTVTMEGTGFTRNSSPLDGGAISNLNGAISITGGNFIDNEASNGNGGAIYNANGAGTVTIEGDIAFVRNIAGDNGGGVWSGGSLIVSDAEFDDNDATNGSGGGIFNANAGTMTITRTSMYTNSAGDRGGGLRNGGVAMVETSTFTMNSADRQGGAIVNHEDMTINNSTIAFNDAGLGGGGIRNASQGMLDIANSIVSDNTAGLPGGDCSDDGVFNSLDYNLDSDGTCPFGMANDISSGNANLGPLIFNGGTTLTHLPGPGSDAIDAGPLTCASPDQRGEMRPRNGVCDIGAVEIVPPPDVCYNLYTGQLRRVTGGACQSPYYLPVIFEEGPHYLCANLHTGSLSYSYGPTCPSYHIPIVMPDTAPLDVCLNLYTSAYRLKQANQTCSTGEVATVLQ